jgi:hypothetical protein
MLINLLAASLICLIATGDPVELPKPSSDTAAWQSLDFENKTTIAQHAERFFIDDSGQLWCMNVPQNKHPQAWYCLDTQKRFDPFERGFDWLNVKALVNARAVSVRLDHLEESGAKAFTKFVVTGLPDESMDTYIGNIYSRGGESSRAHMTVSLVSGNPVSKGDVLYFDYEVVQTGSYERIWWEGGEKHTELLNTYRVRFDPELDEVCPLRPLSAGAFPTLNAKQLAAELRDRKLESIPILELDSSDLAWKVKHTPIHWGD